MSTPNIDLDEEFAKWARATPETYLDLDQAYAVWQDLLVMGFHTEGIKAIFQVFINHHYGEEDQD